MLTYAIIGLTNKSQATVREIQLVKSNKITLWSTLILHKVGIP